MSWLDLLPMDALNDFSTQVYSLATLALLHSPVEGRIQLLCFRLVQYIPALPKNMIVIRALSYGIESILFCVTGFRAHSSQTCATAKQCTSK